MEAHEAFERFSKGREASGESGGPLGWQHGRDAALAVAVMAAFLAVATFLSNEAVKRVITDETRRADTSTKIEANRLKVDVAGGNSVLLRALGPRTPQREGAVAQAERLDSRIDQELIPVDARLNAQIKVDEHSRDTADTQHLNYELSQVGLQVGIVLASVSIIARRRWLLAAGGIMGIAGVVMLIVGILA